MLNLNLNIIGCHPMMNRGAHSAAPSTLLDGLTRWWTASEGPTTWANSVSGGPSLSYTKGASSEAVKSPFKRDYGTRASNTNTFRTASEIAGPNGSFTFSFWFSLTTTAAIQMFGGQWGATKRMWRLWYDKTNTRFTFDISANGTATATSLTLSFAEATLLNNTQHLCTVKYNSVAQTMAIRVSTPSAQGVLTSTAHTTGIYNGGTQYFNVSNDNNGNTSASYYGLVGYWNRVLTVDEETELWNNGRGLQYPFTPTPAHTLTANQFRFFLLPDTQHLYAPTGNRGKELGWRMADMAQELGVNMCIHVGDVRHKINPSDPNVPATWTDAKNSFQSMINRGLLVLPQYGNHDMDDIGRIGPGRLLTEYNTQFPPSYLTNQTAFNGGFYDVADLHNYYHLFTAGGVDYILISLEAVPRNAVLTWAAGLVSANPTRKVIYVSHQILSASVGVNGGLAQFMDANDNTMTGVQFVTMGERNNGSTQYNTVLKPYANSRFSFCGHDNTDSCNGDYILTGDQGNKIVNILRNYQEEDNQTDATKGWFVVCTVDHVAQTIQLQTFLVATLTYNWTASNLTISPADQNVTLSFAP